MVALSRFGGMEVDLAEMGRRSRPDFRSPEIGISIKGLQIRYSQNPWPGPIFATDQAASSEINDREVEKWSGE